MPKDSKRTPSTVDPLEVFVVVFSLIKNIRFYGREKKRKIMTHVFLHWQLSITRVCNERNVTVKLFSSGFGFFN